MLKVLLFFLRSSWQVILLSAIGGGAAAGLNLLSIRYLGDIVKKPDEDPLHSFLISSICIVGAAVLSYIIGRISIKHFELKIATYRNELLERVLKSNYQNIESKLGRLVPVLMFEIGSIGGFGKAIPNVLIAFFQSIAVVGYLTYVSYQLTLILLPFFLIASLVNYFTLPIYKGLEKKTSNERFKLHFGMKRMEAGFKNLILNRKHAKDYIDESIVKHSFGLARIAIRNFLLKESINKALNVFVMVGLGVILLLSITKFGFDQAKLIEYLALALFISPSIIKISNFLKKLKSVENALEQVQELEVDIKKNELNKIEVKSFDSTSSSDFITLENVSFEYERSGFRLSDVSFDIKENEILIINGYNGSGKSTLFKLITGLYKPNEGHIEFKNQPLTEENIFEYRDYFSCHFTDSPVFDDLDYLEKSVNEIDYMIDGLGLKGKTDLKDKYRTIESELSHGQRGRLNLLRLLLEDKPIYFFDEWAANQDIYFKEKFYTEIVPDLKAKGKTVILISHDDKFYHIADRILTVKDGKVKQGVNTYVESTN